ncbi:MAG: hypothetical protein IJZ78_01155 [Alistipes sp.]|nr:hypothetical protein [Alistipes sp.]
MKHLTTLLLLVAATVVAGAVILSLARDNRRLRSNIAALDEGITYYRTRLDASAASVARMQLTISELRRERRHDTEQIRSLGLRLRRVESYATAATVTSVALTIPITSDTAAIMPQSQHDSTLLGRQRQDVQDMHDVRESQRRFTYTTPWLHIAGVLRGDTLNLDYQMVDTLRQVVHRVPRRFLFFRFGTKGIRQEVWSSNPHTRLVYSEYIELGR